MNYYFRNMDELERSAKMDSNAKEEGREEVEEELEGKDSDDKENEDVEGEENEDVDGGENEDVNEEEKEDVDSEEKQDIEEEDLEEEEIEEEEENEDVEDGHEQMENQKNIGSINFYGKTVSTFSNMMSFVTSLDKLTKAFYRPADPSSLAVSRILFGNYYLKPYYM